MFVQHFLDAQQALSAHQKRHIDVLTTGLPHERDEATDMTGGIPSREVRQAYEDVTRGLTDTDKGPPMHRAYQQQKK